jgi:hypothetical protein
MSTQQDHWQSIVDELSSDRFNDELSTVYYVPGTHEKNLYNTITQEQYEQFQYYYVMDALKGWRYGQAFCERFGISNASPLYHFKGRDISERWIRDNYLVKDETKVS